VRNAIRWHGSDSPQAQAAHLLYKACTKRTKRHFDEQRILETAEQWFKEPRRFWSSFKDGLKGCTITDVHAWSACFKSLYAGDATQHYHHGNLHDHLAKFACAFPDGSEAAALAAEELNTPFTDDEVRCALKKMADGKAAGIDGLPAEFLTHACSQEAGSPNLLAPYLARIFNLVMQGAYPTSWATCALVPVPKPKGNPELMDNYRGIAVGNSVAKCYSMLLLQRMDRWAEENSTRACGQAGFRKGRSTSDNIFALLHAVEKSKGTGKPLFTAFIDFRKAYDCIDHELLWQAIEKLGLHGGFLAGLKQMYSQVKMQVKLRDAVGEAFPAGLGVKQGDPLSPLLFGLFIDRFEKFMATHYPAAGVQLPGVLMQLLLYADDLVLFAESAAELQGMLDCLHLFCKANALTVNTNKSQVVVFNTPTHHAHHFTYAEQNMPVGDEYTYLGVTFHSKDGLKSMMNTRTQKARAALCAMLNRCVETRVHNVQIVCNLFNALVAPVLNYGCEAWGMQHLAKLRRNEWGMGYEAEKLQMTLLRRALHVRKSISKAVLMHESGDRVPLAFAWLKQSLAWWNKVVEREQGDVVRAALEDNVQMAQQGMSCWVGCLINTLTQLGLDHREAVHNLQPFDVKSVLSILYDKWHNALWHAVVAPLRRDNLEVRNVPDQNRDGFKQWTYERWFKPSTFMGSQPFIRCVHRADRIEALARFRLGAHHLNIETGRYEHVPRSMRVCTCCHANCREDERHLLECAAYADVRADFSDVVPVHLSPDTSDSSLHQLWNKSEPHEWNRFADFLIRVFKQRATLLAVEPAAVIV
jgi:hypothetical protein